MKEILNEYTSESLNINIWEGEFLVNQINKNCDIKLHEIQWSLVKLGKNCTVETIILYKPVRHNDKKGCSNIFVIIFFFI